MRVEDRLSEVPPALIFRLAGPKPAKPGFIGSTFDWASSPWASDSPGSLAAGIRQAWAARINELYPSAGHPSFEMQQRFTQIQRTLEDRLARPNATEDAKRSFRSSAVNERMHVEKAFGGASAGIQLQVQGPSGHWLGISAYGAALAHGPVVGSTITRAEVERRKIWEHSRLAWAHDFAISAFARSAAEMVTTRNKPVLRVVPDVDEGVSGLVMHGRIPMRTAQRALKRLGSKAKACKITPELLREGMDIEREHRDVTGGSVMKTAKIAAAHICERRDYYKRIKRYVER